MKIILHLVKYPESGYSAQGIGVRSSLHPMGQQQFR